VQTLRLYYQLDFVKPGILPASAYFAEANTAHTKLAYVATGAAVNHVAVVQTHRRRVAGQLVEASKMFFSSPYNRLLKLESQLLFFSE
jgi:hypothetical protein